MFAESLPRLISLKISLFACATESTEPNNSEIHMTPKFQNLRNLDFGTCSFVNREVPGFGHDEAAQYISALLPSETLIDWAGAAIILNEKRSYREQRDFLLWQKFESDFRRLIKGFEQLVEEYMS